MTPFQIRKYFSVTKQLRSSFGLGFESQCHTWLSLFGEIKRDSAHWGPEELPILLALVNPDTYFDQRGVNIGEFFEQPHSRRQFSKSKSIKSNCEISRLIDGVTCPYWRGETLVSDHLWPHSLGGSTSPDNRIFLCKTCNEQKSNSPLLFPSERVPGWLRNRVLLIYQRKERSWH